MTTVQDIIKAKQRAMIPARLLRGAEVLGDLWRSGARCSGGWGSACSCSPAGDFCLAKGRWLGLLKEGWGGPPYTLPWNAPHELSGGEPLFVIDTMSDRMFVASGLTISVQVPGSETPIRVGRNGTVWKTIEDLGALEGTAEYDGALQAVLKIQKVMR